MTSPRRGRTLFHPFATPRGSAEKLRLLLAGQAAIGRATDVEDVLRAALEHALALSGLQAGAGLVQTAGGDRVIVRTVAGTADAALDRLSPGTVLRSPLAQLYERAAAERRPLQHPVPRGGAPAAPPTGMPAAYAVLPLVTARGTVTGALLLASGRYQAPLAPEDLEVLQALGAAAVPAVENAQLHEQLERSLDEVITLYGAGQAISSSLEISEVLDGILEMSRRLTRADYCLITSLGADGEPATLAESGSGADWLAYRTTPGVRLTINAVLRDGALRPLGIPPVSGWCIGLKVRQRVIGTLEVYARGGAPRYDESHLLNGLATQAAIAIENAKLYQEVREKERHLQDLVERMIQAQEDDRRRVAYDIHDGLAQLMVSAHQHLQTFGLLHRRQDPRADEALAKGLFMLQKSIEEVRKVIAGLRPAELDDLGLVPALALSIQSLRDDLGWQIDYVEDVGPERMPATVEVTAYRIIQEALSNARRHGEAQRARVELRRQDNELHLVIQDWGKGFDATSVANRTPGDGEAGHHVGLHSMRERANLLRGTFELHSAVGDGTAIRVTLPIPEDADPATPFPFNFAPVAEPFGGPGGVAGGIAAAPVPPVPAGATAGGDGDVLEGEVPAGGAVGRWPGALRGAAVTLPGASIGVRVAETHDFGGTDGYPESAATAGAVSPDGVGAPGDVRAGEALGAGEDGA